jgi:phenylacetate 2-hydroxylase
MPILDLESLVSIKELLDDCEKGTKDLDPSPYFARFALNTSLTLNYGFRIDEDVNSELLHEITHVEREISNFRSTSNNWQDYVPLLRLWGAQNNSAGEFRARRDKYLTDLLNNLKSRIAEGTDKPCITGNILKDPEAKLNEAEIKSICLTMVSAGLDTVPGNLVMGIAYLATAHGQEIQAKALEEIYKVYPNGEAWEKCLVEEKVPYITALVKEILRFWTVINVKACIRDDLWADIRWHRLSRFVFRGLISRISHTRVQQFPQGPHSSWYVITTALHFRSQPCHFLPCPGRRVSEELTAESIRDEIV